MRTGWLEYFLQALGLGAAPGCLGPGPAEDSRRVAQSVTAGVWALGSGFAGPLSMVWSPGAERVWKLFEDPQGDQGPF